MKKIYLAPEVQVMAVDIYPVMTASDGKLDSGRSINSSEEFGSRGGSLWDDDED